VLKVLKLLIIALIFTAIGWFGFCFGPDRDNAEAKIFERIFSFTKDMPEYLFDDKRTSEPRTIRINGNTTHLTVGQTEDNIEAVLDFYAEQYQPFPIGKPTQEMIDKSPEEVGNNLTKIYDLMDCLGQGQQVHLQREEYGFFGTFEFNDPSLKLGGCEFFKPFEKVVEKGNLGEIGIGRVVIALREKQQDKTTVLNIWTDKDFNLNNLKPDKFGDMPGKDIDDVPRYPGSRRQIAVSQENTRTIDSVVVYEGDGSVNGSILFYRSRMKNAGWKADSTFEDTMKKKSSENLLFYTRKGRECTIHINEDENTGRIITTVIDRKTI